jgi:diguanylate cyclase (GGDEF)-like protein
MELTYPIVRATDGATRWVRSNSQLERNPDGSVKSWFGNMQDITDHKQAEDKVHALAFYDPLTQLANRRLLQDQLEQALLASHRSLSHGALLMLDLDNFKSINDTRGHALGDLLLIEVARRIGASMRAADSVARIGGDEFVVILESLGQDRQQAAALAIQLAEKLRLALQLPYKLEGQTFHSSTSIGIALFQNQDTDFQNLLRQADLALYQAKDAGRNTVRLFEQSMQEAVDRKAAREAGLRDAIANRELVLYYQPQVDQTGHVTGAEALLRWITADGKMVSPADFIPLAEESELILDIGNWVLESGCAQLKVWQSHPETRHLQLALNVSARQFRDADFETQVDRAIARHGIDATGLKLELTESMVLQDVVMVVQRMHALRSCGLKFALDDFGTGYSSLSYLRQLPLDQLKIDQSFVRDLASGSQGPAILKAIIDMGKSLRLEIIAEGVETESQKQFLADSGCGLFQGYLFGRPLPLAQFPLQPRSLLQA